MADENQASAEESISFTVATSVPVAIQPAEDTAGLSDEYSGHGGSYVVDAVTQTRKPNK